MGAEPTRSPPSKWTLPARLEGRALVVARTSWISLTLGLTGLTAAGFVRAFADPQLIVLPPLTDMFTALGLSFRLVMVVALAIPFVVVVVISAIVFRRRSHDPMALVFTLTLVLVYSFGSRSLLTFGETPVLQHSVSVVFALGMVCLVLVLGLFPDGRFVPSSAPWLVGAVTVLFVVFPDGGAMLMALLDGQGGIPDRTRVLLLGWSAVLISGLFAQIYRYRRVSGSRARQQAKWVVVPLGLLMVGLSFVLVLRAVAPSVSDQVVGVVLLVVVPLGILAPVMVVNAVLRYRLYEIDRVIGRTVEYAVVVSVLAVVYATGVLALGRVLSAATGGGGSDLAVAASVLAVVALFRPLQTRVQSTVDRRFNRTHYQMRLVVEGFSQVMRDEASPGAIGRDLATAAASALQPEHVSVWLAEEPDELRRL